MKVQRTQRSVSTTLTDTLDSSCSNESVLSDRHTGQQLFKRVSFVRQTHWTAAVQTSQFCQTDTLNSSCSNESVLSDRHTGHQLFKRVSFVRQTHWTAVVQTSQFCQTDTLDTSCSNESVLEGVDRRRKRRACRYVHMEWRSVAKTLWTMTTGTHRATVQTPTN